MAKTKDDTSQENLVEEPQLDTSLGVNNMKNNNVKEVAEPRVKITNPNRWMVPTMINGEEGLVQLNIEPRSSVELDKSEVTDSIANLVSRKVLVLKQI